MKKIVYGVEIDTKDAEGSIERLTDHLNDLNAAAEKDEKAIMAVENALEKLADQQDKARKASEKAADANKKNVSGLKALGQGIGNTIKALGVIGIALKVFEIFSEALQKNKVFADALSTATNFIQIALTKIVEKSIDPLVAGFKAVFNDPQQALKDLGEAIKVNITNRLEGLLELFPALGKAIKLALKGDFEEAATVAANAAGKVSLGVENIVEKTKTAAIAIGEFATETLKAAEAQTQLDNAIATSAARQEQLRLIAQKAAEEQRQIRDDESKSIEERLAANDKLAEILKNQALAEKAIAGESLARAKAEIANGNSSIQAQTELLDAKNRLLEIDERLSGIISEQIVNNISLRKEALDTVNAQIDAANELKNVGIEATSEQLANDLNAIDQKLQATIDAGLTETQAYRDLLAERDLIDAERAVAKEEERIAKEEQEAEDAEKKIALDKKVADAAIAKAKEERDAKFAFASEVLGQAQQFAGVLQGLSDLIFQNEMNNAEGNDKLQEELRKKQFKANKALGIVTAVINTALAVVGQLSIPGPVGWVGAALAAVTGAINIATIAAAKYQPQGGSSGTRPPAPPAPPSVADSGGAATPNVSFVGGGNNLNTVGNGAPQPQTPINVNANVSISETEITQSQTTVSEYENASLLSSN
jgi:hypothetical protein